MIGTIIADGEICDITQFTMYDHRMWFHAVSRERKDSPSVELQEFRMHGTDGKLIFIVTRPVEIEERVNGLLHIILPVEMTEIANGRRGRPVDV